MASTQTHDTMFLKCARALLFVTGGIKVASCLGDSPQLSKIDVALPFLTLRQLFFAVGLLEIGVAASLLRKTELWTKYATVAWLSLLFATYRLGLFWLEPKRFCGCVGTGVEWLAENSVGVELVMAGMLIWLLVGSWGGLFAHYRLRDTALVIAALAAFPAGSTAQGGGRESANPGFEVQGQIEFQNFAHDGRLTSKEVSQFTFATDGRQWLIHDKQPDGSIVVTGSDGTNVFNALLGEYDGNLAANVLPGLHPQMGAPADVLWLAYASASYLASKHDPPALFYQAASDFRAFAYEPRITLGVQAPYLPSKAEFISSATRFARAKKQPVTMIESEAHQQADGLPSEPDGFVVATYQVLGMTNLAGLSIPSAFETSQHRPVRNSTNLLTGWVSTKAIGKVTQISQTNYPSYLPPLARMADISDLRFRDAEFRIQNILYRTNTWIQNENDPLLQAIWSEKRSKVGLVVKKRVIIIAVLGLILLSPLVWFAKQRVKNQRKPTTEPK